MALSGTTLTVTTLTTAGLLTNNVSGQVSSVTGTSLASLLGGAPTFTGLTLSGLGSGLLKVTSGVVGVATGGDYQAALTQGLNISINPSTNVIATSASPSFTGLTLSSINASMLKTVLGIVTGAVAYADYMPNITSPAGSNLTINTGTNTISVNNPPTFANILNSTINIDNVLYGTGTGGGLTTGFSNTLLGSLAGSNITSGSQNIALGHLAGGVVTTGTYNTYIGTNARASSVTVNNELVISSGLAVANGKGANTAYLNYSNGLFVSNLTGGILASTGTGKIQRSIGTDFISNIGTNNVLLGSNTGITTGSSNASIGYNNLGGLTTGSNNTHLGANTSASSLNVSNEMVLNASSNTAIGRGTNTAFINATAGLYSYSPATCFLYATGFSNNRCQWANYATNNPINNFTFTNYGNGASTVIVPSIPGLYQIDISGAVLSAGGSFIEAWWNNVNIREFQHFHQSFSSNGYAYQVGFSVQSRPYVIPSASGFELRFTGASYWGSVPIFASIRLISL